jgi:hypothetical protein
MEMGGSRARFRGEPELLEVEHNNQHALAADIDADGPLDVEIVEPDPITKLAARILFEPVRSIA